MPERIQFNTSHTEDLVRANIVANADQEIFVEDLVSKLYEDDANILPLLDILLNEYANLITNLQNTPRSFNLTLKKIEQALDQETFAQVLQERVLPFQNLIIYSQQNSEPLLHVIEKIRELVNFWVNIAFQEVNPEIFRKFERVHQVILVGQALPLDEELKEMSAQISAAVNAKKIELRIND